MSSGSFRQIEAQCPFFLSDDLRHKCINCEGMTEDERSNGRRFLSRQRMDFHFDTYCCKRYICCEYYRLLMDTKYQEEG